jgi:magnesium-transporting ATPase (P-type)
VGDPLDLLLFRYTGWQLNDTLGTLRVRPPGFDEAEGDVKGMNSTTWSTEWSVLLRFAFRSDWGRCTVVASGPKNIGMWAFTKGAPEKILGLVDKASVPPSILEVACPYRRLQIF